MRKFSRGWSRRLALSWRKGLVLGAVATFVAATSAACGGSGSAGGSGAQTPLGKDDTLTITTFSDFGYADLIEKWNADPNRPFKVQPTVIADWDPWKATLNSDLQAGTGLTDIVAIEGDAMPQFLAPGASDQFVDISDPSLNGRWIEYKYKAGQTADGKQIGYPTDAGPEGICYRADLLARAGLPTNRDDVAKLFSSWDSYFQAGQTFVSKVPGVHWYDASNTISQAMLNQTKYPFQTADNKVNVDNPELKNVYDTVTKYVPTLSTKVEQWGDDWKAGFANSTVATIPCPGWMFANIKEAAPNVTGWDFADVFPGGGGNWGGSFLAVPQQSKHQAEAKRFANWLTDAAQESAAFEKAGNYPANIAAEQELVSKNATDSYFNNAPTASILANRAKAVQPGLPYKGDKYSDILGLFQSAIQRVDQGTDPAASWQTFVQAVGQLS
ncbi:ABC transporter substrate-binding protein [Amycolatopsis taiwanensis]|uniref:Sugar ABC transporter substrate-binding protein n=1 Tax=Amycolatopsis taiwanensis TaxID=342230 RepID=A0A9W6QY71_9PSEU|nr:extracellular solute-binding protein [Amycolatopsis taiwanensis]GLY65729.1 sugar ABC transporter substrate-binding protein [Amycolatopsis taiwanensis]